MANEALPIVTGYRYGLRIVATGYEAVFPAGAAFRAQVRDFAGSLSPIADLTTENGGIVRINDTTVDLFIKPEDTARCRNVSAVLDFARTDPDPDQFTYLRLQIPVMKPITEGM